MTAPLNPAEIAALAERATEAPWFSGIYTPSETRITAPDGHHFQPPTVLARCLRDRHPHDAALIVYLVNHVPAILALLGENEDARGALDDAGADGDSDTSAIADRIQTLYEERDFYREAWSKVVNVLHPHAEPDDQFEAAEIAGEVKALLGENERLREVERAAREYRLAVMTVGAAKLVEMHGDALATNTKNLAVQDRIAKGDALDRALAALGKEES